MDLDILCQQLKAEQDDMLDATMAASNINSGSHHIVGLEKTAVFFEEKFQMLKADNFQKIQHQSFEHIQNNGKLEQVAVGPMLRLAKRKTAPLKILFVGHMDTVFGETHSFQTATIHNDKLHGPGVADMKGGIVAMLWGLKAFETFVKTPQIGWEVLLTSDEEIGSPVSRKLLAELAPTFQIGLIYEPTLNAAGVLAGDRKGSGKFTIIARGKAAHAGRAFDEGKSAIVALSKVIVAVDALNHQLPGLTINIGHIQGGGAVNVVPALCICQLDIRFAEKNDMVWVQEALEKIIKQANKENDIHIELHGYFGREPKKITDKTKRLYELVKQVGGSIGQQITWEACGGCCDGNNLSAAGLPNIDTLGVRGGNIHSDKEYMVIDSLSERAMLTAALLIHLNEKGFS